MDKVQILTPATLGEYIKYFEGKVDLDYNFYIENVRLDYDYIIKDGDNIIKSTSPEISKPVEIQMGESKEIEIKDEKPAVTIEEVTPKQEENKKAEEKFSSIKVKVNSRDVELKGKNKYVFIDIFSEYDFDRTNAKGLLILKLNGNKAGYFDELKHGDVIEIYWE